MRLSAHQVLVALSVSLVGGSLFGSLYTTSKPWLFIAMAFACAWLGIRLYTSAHTPQAGVRAWTLAVMPWFILGFCMGCVRIQTVLAKPNQYAAGIGSSIDVEALVVAEPDIRTTYQFITIRPDGYEQNLLVTMTLTNRYAYGDRVWVRGKVAAPKLFDDFDYPGYLARFNVFALVRYPKMIVLQQGKGNWVVSKLFAFKHIVIKRIVYLFGPEEGRLLLGILIGAKQGLSPEVTQYFSRTGTSHIMAVSGFNISILLVAFGYASYLCGRKVSNILAVLIVILFVIVAGPTSSVLRAAGMGMLVILATTGRRVYMPLGALLCVGAVMVFINPRVVYWDVGFQLSSAATMGILIGMPLFEHWFGTRFKFLEPLAVSMAAIIFTLPISMWRFGAFSTVALVANACIVPLIPVVMALGALSLLPLLGSGFALLCSWLLHFILWYVAWLAHPAWASVHASISGWLVLILYASLALSIFFLYWLRNPE